MNVRLKYGQLFIAFQYDNDNGHYRMNELEEKQRLVEHSLSLSALAISLRDCPNITHRAR